MINQLFDWVLDHPGGVLAGLFTVLGALWGVLKARRAYKLRSYLERVVVGANILTKEGDNTCLDLVTVAEFNIADVFINTHLVKLVMRAARKCTEYQPIVYMDKDDAEQVKIAVINTISEIFGRQSAELMVARELYTRHTLRFALTMECYGKMRTRKLRILLMVEDDLVQFTNTKWTDGLRVRREYHRDRIRTLAAMDRCRGVTEALGNFVVGSVWIHTRN